MVTEMPLKRTTRSIALIMITIGIGLIWISLLKFELLYRAVAALIWSILVIAAADDLRRHTVHDGVSLAVLILGGVYSFIGRIPFRYWALGFFISSVFMILLYVLSRKSVGLGDVKLIAALGLFLGPMKVFYLLFHASWIGAVVVLVGLSIRRLGKNQEIPFVPFIAVGFLLAIASL